MTYQKELAVALTAVETASRLCARVQSDLEQIAAVIKSDRSPVTVADFGSQAIMSLILRRELAGDIIVAEEDPGPLREQPALLDKVRHLVAETIGPLSPNDLVEAVEAGATSSGDADRFWTMDPIDGTKGFLRREQYAVALALVEGGEVVLGVLGCPNYPGTDGAANGALFSAVKDRGAFEAPLGGGHPTAFAPEEGERTRPLRFCESVESAHAAHAAHRQIADTLGITAPPLRMDSQAKYAAIARGDADIYLRLPRDSAYREKIWDHAAGSILVAEAGGKVSDFGGNPLDFTAGRHLGNRPGLLACRRDIHRQALSAVRNFASK